MISIELDESELERGKPVTLSSTHSLLNDDIVRAKELLKSSNLIYNFPKYVKQRKVQVPDEIRSRRKLLQKLQAIQARFQTWAVKYRSEFSQLKLKIDFVMYLGHQEASFRHFYSIHRNYLGETHLNPPESTLKLKTLLRSSFVLTDTHLKETFHDLRAKYTDVEAIMNRVSDLSEKLDKAIQISSSNIIGFYKWAKSMHTIGVISDLEGLSHPTMLKIEVQEPVHLLYYFLSLLLALFNIFWIMISFLYDPL